LICSQYKMSKVWMLCEVVAGDVRQTAEADEEGIIDAGWFARAQLAGEVVFPPPLMQYNWDQLRSERWQVVCLPSRKTDF